MKLETPSADFSDEQKRYLEGFMSGLQVGRVGRSIGVAAGAGAPAGKADPEPVGPDAAGLRPRTGLFARARSCPIRRSSSASSIHSMPMTV